MGTSTYHFLILCLFCVFFCCFSFFLPHFCRFWWAPTRTDFGDLILLHSADPLVYHIDPHSGLCFGHHSVQAVKRSRIANILFLPSHVFPPAKWCNKICQWLTFQAIRLERLVWGWIIKWILRTDVPSHIAYCISFLPAGQHANTLPGPPTEHDTFNRIGLGVTKRYNANKNTYVTIFSLCCKNSLFL